MLSARNVSVKWVQNNKYKIGAIRCKWFSIQLSFSNSFQISAIWRAGSRNEKLYKYKEVERRIIDLKRSCVTEIYSINKFEFILINPAVSTWPTSTTYVEKLRNVDAISCWHHVALYPRTFENISNSRKIQKWIQFLERKRQWSESTAMNRLTRKLKSNNSPAWINYQPEWFGMN